MLSHTCFFCKGIRTNDPLEPSRCFCTGAIPPKDTTNPLNAMIPMMLTQCFKNPGSKTLKLEIKPGTNLPAAVENAYRYIREPSAVYTRVEFKFENCYIVVARLKDGGKGDE